MEWISLASWWVGNALLVCLLVRARSQHLFSKYRFFYFYLWVIASSELARHLLPFAHRRILFIGWWISEAVTAVAGFAVTWEIFTQMLLPFAGARRMARAVLPALLSAVVLKAATAWVSRPFVAPNVSDLERDLRILQVLLLVALVGLIVHYALPMGRNVRSMLVGYGGYLGVHLILLTLRSEWGASFDPWMAVLPGSWYNVALAVWCVGLWSFQPNPPSDLLLELDYERLARRTSRALDRLRDHVVESWRA